MHTENQNQVSFYPFVLHEISVLIELTLGHLCYRLTDVPPQPNSPPEIVLCTAQPTKESTLKQKLAKGKVQSHRVSRSSTRVEVFQDCLRSFLCYTPCDNPQIRLESNSIGSSFPAVYVKPVPLTVVSLDSR